MNVTVDQVSDQVGGRMAGLPDRGPGPPGTLVCGELVQREGLVIGDLGHSDVPEPPPGRPLDVLESWQVFRFNCPDAHLVIVPALRRLARAVSPVVIAGGRSLPHRFPTARGAPPTGVPPASSARGSSRRRPVSARSWRSAGP